MKKLAFLCLCLLVSGGAMAEFDMDHLYQLGLPKSAVAATTYFEAPFAEVPHTSTDQDCENSTFSGLEEQYTFFVERLRKVPDEDFYLVNIWMYSAWKDQVTKVLSQESQYQDLLIKGLCCIVDKQQRFIEHTIEDTGQKVMLQDFTEAPVVIIMSELYNGTMHAFQTTLLAYPYTNEVKVLENEMFVSVSHTLTNMLMAAEMAFAQDYIITTSTEVRSEEVPLQENSEYILFYKQYLRPLLHIYNTKGELMQTVTLPQDEVDMVR
ncbi:MAG: hypothetical protein IKX36_00325 [Prevotella sp.]|nr:hypothetical protein [Prevotella sp.]